ncbi:hypothetical protein [Gimesia sp.]|uniref:hypothetical protein n=1 Tax=Gimesia sp. TaxID=2024833 RepID=UPI000C584198|nr:hypothetical protein [Gimesia sp.]MAX39632.1 hypothetical protein [Gimesia sp.]|tara:strand:- start:14368 stop:14805 length:438 start_codon:yes stop_codon:yes gene_type:complete
MFEFEDHNSLEEQLLQAGAGAAVPLRDGHRQQVLEAAQQAGNRRQRRRRWITCSMLFVCCGLFWSLRGSGSTQSQAPGWSRAIYIKGNEVLGISTVTRQSAAIKTDWNSVQATLKHSGEWGLVDAVVQFRNERAGTIEQIFHRGD